ncbi:MAG TPA: PDZ domain-containing protein [Verrucomicrobiae bacterium]|nr:PDZ domain-containing protein [Verrucomicrobiae bacterium]
MRKQDFFHQLSSAISRLGIPRKDVRRLAEETTDHWEDLEAEARIAGLDDPAACAFASKRIGDPAALAQLHRQRMRQAHWSGRHPIWSFAVVPPVLLILWFLAWSLMAVTAADIYTSLLRLPEQISGSYLMVLVWATVVRYTGIVAVPAISWWWARRNFCGCTWGWIACGACALHGLLNHVTIRAHSLSWGYGWAAPDWLAVIAPLTVGMVAQCLNRSTFAKFAFALCIIALGTGCASPKHPQERGWIGGEYKQAPADSRGVLITRLSTNTPAAHSGLREGDLIVRVEGKRVNDPRTFFKAIDAAVPASRLSLELLRDGANVQRSVTVGKELFKPDHSLTMGVLLSREWDLWPNPDFSLVALGYKRQENRTELDSPESRFELSGHGPDQPERTDGLRSREGWEVWLPVCSFSSRKRILAQTAVE